MASTISVSKREISATVSYLNKLAKQADNNPRAGYLNSREVKERLGVGTAAFQKIVTTAQYRQGAKDRLGKDADGKQRKASSVELSTFASSLSDAGKTARTVAGTRTVEDRKAGRKAGVVNGDELDKLQRRSLSAASLVRLAWALKQAGEI
jgi:hypothetical protein